MPRLRATRAKASLPRHLLFVVLAQLAACAELPIELSLPTAQQPAPREAAVSFEHGAFLGDAESSREAIASSIAAYAQKVGTRPSIIKTFFRIDDDFTASGWPGQTIRTIEAAGARNLIALDLRWDGAPARDLLAAIVRGDADPHIRKLAHALKGLETPVLLEPAWEMNGNWGYAWQGVANGADESAPAAFVRAWRHLVDVMRAEGATNVRFVFSPNVGNPVAGAAGQTHWNWYGYYYPGDAYVDLIGLHGFNAPALWGGSDAAFMQLFDGAALDRMLSDIAGRFPAKSVLISEFAVGESGNKPEWIRAAYAAMRARPQIVGAIWFNMKKEADWRIDSSAASLASYRDAIRSTD